MTEREHEGEASAEAAGDGARAGPIRLRRTRRPRRPRRRSVVLRVARIAALALLLVASVIGTMLWRLNAGPLSVDGLSERVAVALESQFGQGYDVQVRHSQIEWPQGGPRLSVTGVTVRDGQGNLVVAAPQADISFDPTALAFGQLKPRDIFFVGPAVSLTIAADGTVSVSAAGEEEARSEPAPGSAEPPPAPGSAFGPASLLDPLLRSAGPLAVLERAGIRDGRLRVNDMRRGRTVTYDRLSLQFSRGEPDQTRLRVSARGPVGSWAAQADVTGKPGERRDVRVSVQNVSVAEFIGFSEPGSIPATTDMPINGDLSLTLAADNTIETLSGRITGGSAIVMFEHPDAEPVFVDSVKGEFGWDPAAHAITVPTLQFSGGDTQWRLRGRIGIPQVDGGFWTVALDSDDSAMAGDGPQDKPVQIDRLTLQARLPIGLTGVQIDKLELAGPEAALALTATIGRFGDVDGLRLGLTSGRMPARNVLAFWPSVVASDVRTWMIEAVQGGTVESFSLATSLSRAALVEAFAQHPLPDDGLRIEVRVSGASLRPGKGLPIIEDIAAQALVTGRTARVTASKGAMGASGRALAFSNVVLTIADTGGKPPVLQLETALAGGADAAMEALRAPAIRPFAPLPTDLAGVRGQVDGKLKLSLPLMPQPKPSEVLVQVSGQATGVSAEGLFGREKLEGGTFTFSQDKGGLTIKGDGKLTGSPATFELRQAPGGPTDATVTLVLDDAARARRGIKPPGQLTGPIDVKVLVADAAGAKPVTRVETDLAKATISDVLPGWTKPAGRPAKLSFRLEQDAEQISLEDMTLDAFGGVQAKGSVRLGADGSLMSARLSSLRLAPGDDMKIEADRQGGVMRTTVRATQIDARPLVRAATAPGAGTGSGSIPDVEFDVRAQTVIGENNEKLSGLDLKFSLKGGDLRDLRLAGRFGAVPVSAQPARAEGGASGFVIESGDAGSFLRFFDIYRRMIGGTLILQLFGSPPQMTGEIIVNGFALANEPALARVAQGDPERGNSVAFTKLRAGFTAGGGRLEIRDGTMWGNAVGGTLEGTLDFNRDRADLSGTFVPAYGINNALNRVPIVGTLLGGGQNEGLFAVNFRITGRVTQPSLSINPLSAVAPGVLRKFFGVFGPGVSVGGNPGAPGTPPPQPPAPLPDR